MSGNALIRGDQSKRDAIVAAVLDGLDSPHSKRAYRRALVDFMAWYRETGQVRLDKATVNRYRAYMVEQGTGTASINQRLSAIRKLANEAADLGAIRDRVANGIGRVPGVKHEGEPTGNWLTARQAEQLLDAPARDTLLGLRDRALLAVLVGCGLRRSEAAALTFDHIRMRDARWVSLDLVGKRGRTRTVPMPPWAKARIDTWAKAAGISEGHVFRPINKGGNITGVSTTSQAVYRAVQRYAEPLGFEIAAHDLRRTFAKLAHKGGCPMEQIQLSLGHSSIQTTERYLGVDQNLTSAPCDYLGLAVEVNGMGQ